jgi:hypothetical protein
LTRAAADFAGPQLVQLALTPLANPMGVR